jgi:hypothetical protein
LTPAREVEVSNVLNDALNLATEMKQKLNKLSQQYVTARTLMGINVRLLPLKQETRSNSTGLKNEIASTQRLVEESVQSIKLVRA